MLDLVINLTAAESIVLSPTVINVEKKKQICHIKALITSLMSRRIFCLIQSTLPHFRQTRQLLDEPQMLVRISIDIFRIFNHQAIQNRFIFRHFAGRTTTNSAQN